MNSKPVYKSRTIWVNLLALIGLFLQQKYGFVLNMEAQSAILIILNLVLRFDTKSAISVDK